MKKSIVLITIVFMQLSMVANSKNITIENAKKVAHNFYYERNYQNINFEYTSQLISNYYSVELNSKTVMYFINYKQGGWVAVSAVDNVIPIVAYSFSGNYNPDFAPDNFKAWISQYKYQINEAINNHIIAPANTNELWKHYLSNDPSLLREYRSKGDVGPLINTTWDQGLYYNEMCPEDGGGPGGHCLTGCVPTCMAQICNYFRFPQSGTGSYSYNCPPYGELFADFGEADYNWNEMASNLSVNNLETAQIIYHLGVSCDIVYGPDGSGMYNHKAAYALRNHFKYSPETQYLYRDSTNLNWDSVIIAHLDKKIPLYYAGWSVPNINGHAFVCDGYQDSSYFHFNWGWSGSNDGYFYTSNLNPGGNNFNLAQELIINCFPDTINYQYPIYCNGSDTLVSLFGTIDDGSGPIYNYADNLVCSWLISPTDSVNSITLDFIEFSTDITDTLLVYDGNSSNSPILGYFTGNNIPSSISSSSDELYLEFHTDTENTESGWLIEFSSEIPQFCSNNVITSWSGEISDGSGPANYQNLTTCLWMIQPTNAGIIDLNFSSFSTELDHDFVTIYDGSEKLGEFSGNSIPENISAVNGMMTIVFSTNSSITDNGWTASYSTSAVEIGEISSKSEIMIYPIPADNSLNITQQDSSSELKFYLYNSVGKVIMDGSLFSSYNTINTSKLPNGIYFLKLSSSNYSQSKKVIIKH